MKVSQRIQLVGMDVLLIQNFLSYPTDRPRRLHSHPAYELVFAEQEEGARFFINPPATEHLTADVPPQTAFSLLFSFRQEAENDVCRRFESLTAPIELEDRFHGADRIRQIRALTELPLSDGAEEQLKAELRLLFVCLARTLPVRKEKAEAASSSDQELLTILEHHFNVELKDPDCSKKKLARRLGVCERQLSRILDRVYHDSYSALLLRSRMNIAQAMHQKGIRSPERLAEAVGYRSASAFCRARKRFLAEKAKKYTD